MSYAETWHLQGREKIKKISVLCTLTLMKRQRERAPSSWRVKEGHCSCWMLSILSYNLHTWSTAPTPIGQWQGYLIPLITERYFRIVQSIQFLIHAPKNSNDVGTGEIQRVYLFNFDLNGPKLPFRNKILWLMTNFSMLFPRINPKSTVSLVFLK